MSDLSLFDVEAPPAQRPLGSAVLSDCERIQRHAPVLIFIAVWGTTWTFLSWVID